MNWIERASFSHVKHPNHVFLLQNVYGRLIFTKPEQVTKMVFRGVEEDDPNPWLKFFFIIDEKARPSDGNGIGWGTGLKRNDYKTFQSSGSGKKRGNKKKYGKKVKQ